MIDVKIRTTEDMIEFFTEFCLRDTDDDVKINKIIEYVIDLDAETYQVEELYQLLKSKEK